MSARRRDPRAEKDRDYAHGVVAASSSGLRDHKPKRKVATHRAERVRWTGLLASPSVAPDTLDVRGFGVRRRREDVALSVPLAGAAIEAAAGRLVARVEAYAGTPYDPQRHRGAIVDALEQVTQPRRRRGAGTGGRLVNELMPYPIRPFGRWGSWSRWAGDPPQTLRRRVWFATFLDAEPEWAQRVASWIELEHRALVMGAR